MGYKEEFGCLMTVIDPIVGSNINEQLIPQRRWVFSLVSDFSLNQ